MMLHSVIRCTAGPGTMIAGLLLLCCVLNSEASDCDEASEQEKSSAWVEDGGFLILILGVSAMFWGLAVVCEEYFVPALNILCEELNVPDDVAGATFMAAGASSPELFTSFIALFINHSAIGVGTVVGSEIFNHMIICAGSVLYSTTGVLQLDKWIFTRDVASYFLSLVILIWALKGNLIEALPRMFNSSERDKCLNVTIYHAAGLVALYVVYAIVSGSFQSILKMTCRASKPAKSELEEELVTNVLTEPTAEEISRLQEADADRVAAVLADMLGTPCDSESQAGGSRGAKSVSLKRSVQFQRSAKYRPTSVRAIAEDDEPDVVDWSHHRSTFVPDAPLYTWRSSALHLPNLEDEATEGVVNIVTTPIKSGWCCVVNKASTTEYCTMALAPKHLSAYLELRQSSYGVLSWDRRYYTIDYLGFHSRKALTSPIRGEHIAYIDISDVISVEITNKEEGLFHLLKKGGDKVEFCSPSVDVLTTVVKRLEAHLDTIRQKSAYERDEFVRTSSRELQTGIGYPDTQAIIRDFRDTANDVEASQSGAHDSHGCLLDAPHVEPGDVWGPLKLGIHYGLYPLKFMMFYSLPDVSGKEGRSKYITCMLSSIAWLALLSFIMIQCCDEIGKFIGASPITMGLTLSAVGTSFPNLWSSMLVARQGLGDMAVSNAFGSNTFNICIALGMPWLVLVLSNDFTAYDKMRDDGIVLMLTILLVVLIIFYVVVMLHDWQIRVWMSYYYIATYVAIMVFAIING